MYFLDNPATASRAVGASPPRQQHAFYVAPVSQSSLPTNSRGRRATAGKSRGGPKPRGAMPTTPTPPTLLPITCASPAANPLDFDNGFDSDAALSPMAAGDDERPYGSGTNLFEHRPGVDDDTNNSRRRRESGGDRRRKPGERSTANGGGPRRGGTPPSEGVSHGTMRDGAPDRPGDTPDRRQPDKKKREEAPRNFGLPAEIGGRNANSDDDEADADRQSGSGHGSDEGDDARPSKALTSKERRAQLVAAYSRAIVAKDHVALRHLCHNSPLDAKGKATPMGSYCNALFFAIAERNVEATLMLIDAGFPVGIAVRASVVASDVPSLGVAGDLGSVGDDNPMARITAIGFALRRLPCVVLAMLKCGSERHVRHVDREGRTLLHHVLACKYLPFRWIEEVAFPASPSNPSLLASPPQYCAPRGDMRPRPETDKDDDEDGDHKGGGVASFFSRSRQRSVDLPDSEKYGFERMPIIRLLVEEWTLSATDRDANGLSPLLIAHDNYLQLDYESDEILEYLNAPPKQSAVAVVMSRQGISSLMHHPCMRLLIILLAVGTHALMYLTDFLARGARIDVGSARTTGPFVALDPTRLREPPLSPDSSSPAAMPSSWWALYSIQDTLWESATSADVRINATSAMSASISPPSVIVSLMPPSYYQYGRHQLAYFPFVFDVISMVCTRWPTDESTVLAVKLACIISGIVLGALVSGYLIHGLLRAMGFGLFGALPTHLQRAFESAQRGASASRGTGTVQFRDDDDAAATFENTDAAFEDGGTVLSYDRSSTSFQDTNGGLESQKTAKNRQSQNQLLSGSQSRMRRNADAATDVTDHSASLQQEDSEATRRRHDLIISRRIAEQRQRKQKAAVLNDPLALLPRHQDARDCCQLASTRGRSFFAFVGAWAGVYCGGLLYNELLLRRLIGLGSWPIEIIQQFLMTPYLDHVNENIASYAFFAASLIALSLLFWTVLDVMMQSLAFVTRPTDLPVLARSCAWYRSTFIGGFCGCFGDTDGYASWTTGSVRWVAAYVFLAAVCFAVVFPFTAMRPATTTREGSLTMNEGKETSNASTIAPSPPVDQARVAAAVVSPLPPPPSQEVVPSQEGASTTNDDGFRTPMSSSPRLRSATTNRRRPKAARRGAARQEEPSAGALSSGGTQEEGTVVIRRPFVDWNDVSFGKAFIASTHLEVNLFLAAVGIALLSLTLFLDWSGSGAIAMVVERYAMEDVLQEDSDDDDARGADSSDDDAEHADVFALEEQLAAKRLAEDDAAMMRSHDSLSMTSATVPGQVADGGADMTDRDAQAAQRARRRLDTMVPISSPDARGGAGRGGSAATRRPADLTNAGCTVIPDAAFRHVARRMDEETRVASVAFRFSTLNPADAKGSAERRRRRRHAPTIGFGRAQPALRLPFLRSVKGNTTFLQWCIVLIPVVLDVRYFVRYLAALMFAARQLRDVQFPAGHLPTMDTWRVPPNLTCVLGLMMTSLLASSTDAEGSSASSSSHVTVATAHNDYQYPVDACSTKSGSEDTVSRDLSQPADSFYYPYSSFRLVAYLSPSAATVFVLEPDRRQSNIFEGVHSSLFYAQPEPERWWRTWFILAFAAACLPVMLAFQGWVLFVLASHVSCSWHRNGDDGLDQQQRPLEGTGGSAALNLFVDPLERLAMPFPVFVMGEDIFHGVGTSRSRSSASRRKAQRSAHAASTAESAKALSQLAGGSAGQQNNKLKGTTFTATLEGWKDLSERQLTAKAAQRQIEEDRVHQEALSSAQEAARSEQEASAPFRVNGGDHLFSPSSQQPSQQPRVPRATTPVAGSLTGPSAAAATASSPVPAGATTPAGGSGGYSPSQQHLMRGCWHLFGARATVKEQRALYDDIWYCAYAGETVRVTSLLDACPALTNMRGGIGITITYVPAHVVPSHLAGSPRTRGRNKLPGPPDSRPRITALLGRSKGDPTSSGNVADFVAPPLHYAILGNREAVVSTLLSRRASVHARCADGLVTALELALYCGHVHSNIRRLLEDHHDDGPM